AEEQDFGRQEVPHPQRRCLLLVFGVGVLLIGDMTGQDGESQRLALVGRQQRLLRAHFVPSPRGTRTARGRRLVSWRSSRAAGAAGGSFLPSPRGFLAGREAGGGFVGEFRGGGGPPPLPPQPGRAPGVRTRALTSKQRYRQVERGQKIADTQDRRPRRGHHIP